MAACTYVFAVNQGKHPDVAMEITDKLFVGIMRGNKIKPEIMFTEDRNIKPTIANEVSQRTALCKKQPQKLFHNFLRLEVWMSSLQRYKKD